MEKILVQIKLECVMSIALIYFEKLENLRKFKSIIDEPVKF